MTFIHLTMLLAVALSGLSCGDANFRAGSRISKRTQDPSQKIPGEDSLAKNKDKEQTIIENQDPDNPIEQTNIKNKVPTDPVFNSLDLINDASDFYINLAEKSHDLELAGNLKAEFYSKAFYAVTEVPILCKNAMNYGPSPSLYLQF